jgi:hypothetical protein
LLKKQLQDYMSSSAMNFRKLGPIHSELSEWTFQVLTQIHRNYPTLCDGRDKLIQLRTELVSLSDTYFEMNQALQDETPKVFPDGLREGALALKEILELLFESMRRYHVPPSRTLPWPFTQDEQDKIIGKIHSAKVSILGALKPMYDVVCVF